jgi:hypothetical protein
MTPNEIKEAKEKHKERKKEYYSFTSVISNMQWTLKNSHNNRRSIAYKQLCLALEAYEQQIRDDFYRYEKIVSSREQKNEMKALQQSLNRERKLREGLESKIKEAAESSGLFISYVRKKLKF